jgi:hypothetical protein
MASRRDMAMDIGGRWLLQSMMRQWPGRYRRHRETREQVTDRRVADLDHSDFADTELPEIMTKGAESLSDDEKKVIREAYYDNANMTVPALRRWLYDPRLTDAVNPVKRFWVIRARAHLRSLIYLRAIARFDGHGWGEEQYNVARKSIFVIETLYHPRKIDYETWVVLQTYGRDWARPTRYEPFRRLPPLVQLEAELARVRHAISGTPVSVSQL